MVFASASVRSGTLAAAMFWRIDQTVCSQFCSLVRVATMRAVSWQTVHFVSTSALPSPSGSLIAPGLGIWASGKRSGQAAGNDGPRVLTSARLITAGLPAPTATGVEVLLSFSAPTASAVYFPD